MKRAISFIRTTLIGGIIGLVPVVIAAIILKRTFGSIREIITPWALSLGADHKIGKLIILIGAILILVLVCFVAGLIMRSSKFNARFPIVDNLAARLIPGFEVIRAQSNERYGVKLSNPWQAILFEHENAWNIGFIVEKTDESSTIFVPEAPKMDAGDIKIIRNDELRAVPIQAKEAFGFLRKFGAGAGAKLDAANIRR